MKIKYEGQTIEYDPDRDEKSGDGWCWIETGRYYLTQRKAEAAIDRADGKDEATKKPKFTPLPAFYDDQFKPVTVTGKDDDGNYWIRHEGELARWETKRQKVRSYSLYAKTEANIATIEKIQAKRAEANKLRDEARELEAGLQGFADYLAEQEKAQKATQ